MKKLIPVVLFVLALFAACPPVGAQTRTIHLGKSLIRTSNPGAMSMPGMPGMPIVTFPNTYNSTVTASFDPNTGSAGTLYLNYQFTGTTQQNPMCTNSNAHHFPHVGVYVYNNGTEKSYHYSQGYQVAPCVQMNQTLTLAFDLGSDQCQLSLFIDGTCTLTEQSDDVQCTVAGDFAFFLKKFQLEQADTQLLGTDAPRPPGGQNLVPNCLNTPDWKGPSWTFTINPGHDFAAEATMIRFQLIGLDFYGVPWKYLAQFGDTIIAYYPGSQYCTNKDNGPPQTVFPL